LRARGFCFFKLQRTRLFEVRYEHSHQKRNASMDTILAFLFFI
jgi:hypothetical protein